MKVCDVCRYPNGSHPADCPRRYKGLVVQLWGRQYVLLKQSAPGYIAVRIGEFEFID